MSTVICRICLRTDIIAVNIASELADFIDVLCEYNIIKNPRYKCCSICTHLLKKFYNFKQRCLKACLILKSLKGRQKFLPTDLHEQIPSSIGICHSLAPYKLFQHQNDTNTLILNIEPNYTINNTQVNQNNIETTPKVPDHIEVKDEPMPDIETMQGVDNEYIYIITTNDDHMSKESNYEEQPKRIKLLPNKLDTTTNKDASKYKQSNNLLKNFEEDHKDKDNRIDAEDMEVRDTTFMLNNDPLHEDKYLNSMDDIQSDISDCDVESLPSNEQDMESDSDLDNLFDIKQKAINKKMKVNEIEDLELERRVQFLKDKERVKEGILKLFEGDDYDLGDGIKISKEVFLKMYERCVHISPDHFNSYNFKDTSDKKKTDSFLRYMYKIYNPEYEVLDIEYLDAEEKKLQVPKKRKNEDSKWIFVKKFENRDKVEVAVKNEGIWSPHYHHQTEDGKKKYYRCNKLKKRGPQCSAKMYLLFENTSDSVIMYKTDADHDHHEKTITSTHGLSDALKAEINKLFEIKMKPKAIMQHLNEMTHINPPKMTQLRNYLSIRRRRTVNDPKCIHLSLGELEAWILSLTTPPEDPHKAFVISHQIDASDEMKPAFRFAISTKHLIEIARDVSVVHLDATYKMIWQGFPVFVCGTTDQNRKFHPLCLAVTSNEQKEDFKVIFEGLQKTIQKCFGSTWCPKVIVCDAAKSIQNAFVEVFGDNVVIRMCWARVKKNIRERVEMIDNRELRSEILDAVDTLHSITCPNIFDAASEAFLQKYKNETEFIEYFREHWLQQNRNWFLGASPNSPSTNNALESFNRLIKDSETVRERLPLSRFLVATTEIVNKWSTKYTTNPKENFVARTPSITLKNWKESYQWAKMKKKVTVIHIEDYYKHYQIPAGEDNCCQIFEKPWESFDEFKNQNFSEWMVSLPIDKNDWMQGKCNCPGFFKVYICKHVIGLAIRLKYVSPPPEVKEKRKRRHPS